MIWIILVLACIACWSISDLCYKKGSDYEDRLSHLKFLVWLGIIMGITSFLLFPWSESGLPFGALVLKYVDYAPFALAYVLALMCGIIGARYLDISVASPLENIDGAVAAAVLLVYFAVTGTVSNHAGQFTWLDPFGFIFIVVGTILLGIQEQRRSKAEEANVGKNQHKLGAVAFIFPFIYTLFDAASMVFEGAILQADNGEMMGEIDFIILEGFTFFAVGVVAWIWLLFVQKTVYLPFRRGELVKCGAAVTESVGNTLFAFAIAINPVLTPPVTTTYFIFTILGAKLFLKEKMSRQQYLCLFILSVGIILLGISEILKNM